MSSKDILCAVYDHVHSLRDFVRLQGAPGVLGTEDTFMDSDPRYAHTWVAFMTGTEHGTADTGVPWPASGPASLAHVSGTQGPCTPRPPCARLCTRALATCCWPGCRARQPISSPSVTGLYGRRVRMDAGRQACRARIAQTGLSVGSRVPLAQCGRGASFGRLVGDPPHTVGRARAQLRTQTRTSCVALVRTGSATCCVPRPFLSLGSARACCK